MAPRGDAAVFLDRDGTLVEDLPFNVDPARAQFTSDALLALRAMADSGFAIVVVTNQPGVATARFTEAELQHFHDALRSRIREEAGVEVLGIYACPHAPDPRGRVNRAGRARRRRAP